MTERGGKDRETSWGRPPTLYLDSPRCSLHHYLCSAFWSGSPGGGSQRSSADKHPEEGLLGCGPQLWKVSSIGGPLSSSTDCLLEIREEGTFCQDFYKCLPGGFNGGVGFCITAGGWGFYVFYGYFM